MSAVMEQHSEIVEYNVTAVALADLAGRYAGMVYDCKTATGMESAVRARKELRDLRLKLEDTRKVLKEPALRRSQLIDSEARRITAKISELEDPIDEQIKNETMREKREAEARAKAEAERIAKEEAEKKAAEEKRMAEERAKLEAERREFEATQRKAREAEEARQAAERAKLAEERAKLDKEAAERRAVLEAEERVSREARAAEEAKAKAERDRVAAEAAKVEAEKRGARVLMKTFVERFGHRKEFAKVVKAINEVLS